MLDPEIRQFLDDRTKRRVELKSKEQLKKTGELTTLDQTEIEVAAADEYSLNNWLIYCAKNAHGISLTTHPCKFSHPDANSNPIYYQSKTKGTGYLFTQEKNNDVIFSTAAYMPIYSFLTLKLNDKKELLEHLVENTDYIKSQFNIVENFESLRESLLKVKVNNDYQQSTDEKIKQVFFPVEEKYHLLSILSSSVVMYELKSKLKKMNSFEENKSAMEAKKEGLFSKDYQEVYNLTLQGHVKSNPQCISQLNKDNFGESYLLMSTPPSIEKRSIYFPKINFFTESFRYRDYVDVFHALHKIFKTDYNKINIREGRDYRLQELLDRIIDKMWAVRSIAKVQYYEKSSKLKKHQEIWLCEEFIQEREEDDVWLEKLAKEISSWITLSYEKVMGKQAIKLGKEELLKIAEIVDLNKEALR